jgi:hypothetical protein
MATTKVDPMLFTKEEFSFLHTILLQETPAKDPTWIKVSEKEGISLNKNEILLVKNLFNQWQSGDLSFD